MRWLILTLIYAGTLFAQPNGPFEIVVAESPASLDWPRVVVNDSDIAFVCYVESNDSTQAVKMLSVNAVTGDIVSEPIAVLATDSQSLRIDDVALDASGRPVILLVAAEGSEHHLQLVQQLDDAWISTTLYTVMDYFALPCGMLHINLQGSQFLASGGEVIQVITQEAGMSCPQFPEPYSRVVACFFESPVTFNTVVMDDFTVYAEQPPLRGYSITPDSIQVWSQGYDWGDTRFAISRDGACSIVGSYACPHGELTGMRLRDNTFVHVTGLTLCIPPCLILTRIDADSCAGGEEIRPERYPASASVYQDHGFVFPIYDALRVDLMRVDTAGIVVAATGSIAWQQNGAAITFAITDVSPQGTVVTVWSDHNSVNGALKLWLSSCDWLTPLDAREVTNPVPQEYALSTYPNPFNSTVRIDYELPQASDVELTVHNTLGQKVATLFSGREQAGSHSLNWSPETASGVYFVKLASGEFVTSRKVLYIR